MGMASAVAVGMYFCGGMQIPGFATTASALVLSAIAWLGANICVGLAEEFWYRSYLPQTLWKNIGFWPASILISLIFAADHCALLAASFNGPAWLTGGDLGTEASFLMYPIIALAWLYIWWQFRGPARTRKFDPPQDRRKPLKLPVRLLP
jgi:membrane protease YdiL (CAAX protease family)